jgi:GNAT superfamily N-acetyltransferase
MTGMPIHIEPFLVDDEPGWQVLARAYKTFYEESPSDAAYATAWRRLLQQDGVWGLGAKRDGQLVGMTHYLFHTSAWMPTVCYLQDLFVMPEHRGQGIALALIEAVAEAARERQAQRLYWLTQDHNATARSLYDKVAQYKGFLRYDFPL